MAHTQLYLVRHGEQDPASGHASTGGLSQRGREQAARLARRLRGMPISSIHHSPLTRATQTADIIAGHLSQVPRHACDLLGDRTPVPSAAERGHYPNWSLAWLDGVPDDERDEDASTLRATVEHFGVTRDDDRHEVLITHNFVIGWFVRHTLDAPVWRWLGLNQNNCAITIVRWDSDGLPTLVSFNDTGHL